jgi:GT2 family glycosyltransferase
MSECPWITVVTVVKDDPSGLERSLSSLTDQDLTDVEFIVVDSSSDAQEVLACIEGASVRDKCRDLRIERTPAEGIYPAMNHGLTLARGRFIYFLNAGDEFADPATLATLKNSVSHDTVSWLFGRTQIIGTDGTTITTPAWNYHRERESGFSRGHFPSHQSTLMSTDLLRSIGGFDEDYRVVADYDAFLQASQISGPEQLDICVGRFHEGGASTRHWARAEWEFHAARRRRLPLTGRAALRERAGTLRHFLSAAAYRSPWPLGILLAVVTWVVMALTSVTAGNAGLLVLFAAVQAVGGGLWWRLVQPRRSISVLEVTGVGIALGTAGAMLTGLIGAWWAVAGASGLVWLLRRRGAPMAVMKPLSRPELVAVLVGAVPGIGAFLWALRSYPLEWTGLWTGYHGDMPFFEALATSVARLGPGASIFMDGADLRYHSLAYGWAGQLTAATGAEPFVVLTRLLPLVMLMGAIALVAAWARQLSSSAWAPSVAVLLIVTGGFVGATFGDVLNFDSPSQSVGAVWLLGLSIIFLRTLDSDQRWWILPPISVLAVALTGGKVSSAAIGGVGLGAVALVALVRREKWWRRAIIATGVVGVSMIASYLWLLAGSANAGGLSAFALLDRAASVQGLNPVITPRGIVAGIVILALAIVPRWAGLGWLMINPSTRWKPETVYGVGVALAALVALATLSGGFNDLWFAVAASAPLAVLSAVGASLAVQSLDAHVRKRAWIAFVSGLGIAVVVAAIWTTGSTGVLGNGWRWAGPIAGFVLALFVALVLSWRTGHQRRATAVVFVTVTLVSAALPSKVLYGIAIPFAPIQEGSMSTVLFRLQPDYIETIDGERTFGWTDTQSAAGRWLRENTSPDELVATNLTLSALVPALSQRTTYVSDIHMQAPYGFAESESEIQSRESESWAFIDQPSASSLSPLCAAGVRWVWVDSERTTNRQWEPYARTVVEYPDVTILEIDQSACG